MERVDALLSPSDDEVGGLLAQSGASGSEQSNTVRFGKKVFASICDTPLGLTRTFCSAGVRGRPLPARMREEG
jgi:hypothetical protein